MTEACPRCGGAWGDSRHGGCQQCGNTDPNYTKRQTPRTAPRDIAEAMAVGLREQFAAMGYEIVQTASLERMAQRLEVAESERSNLGRSLHLVRNVIDFYSSGYLDTVIDRDRILGELRAAVAGTHQAEPAADNEPRRTA